MPDKGPSPVGANVGGGVDVVTTQELYNCMAFTPDDEFPALSDNYALYSAIRYTCEELENVDATTKERSSSKR